MATLKNVHFGIHINEARWSSSSSGWSLILNTGGIDVLNSTVDYKRKFPEGHARQFPQEGFARVFSFGTKFQPNFFDWVPTDFNVQTDLLNPSSARFDIHGDDLIRPLHVVLWGLDPGRAVVPLTLDVDLMVDISDDVVEGPSSIPLTLVDSGNDYTPFREVILYVLLDPDDNAATQQPVSFRIEDANGALLFESELVDFFQLEPLQYTDARDAKIWRLIETAPPITRVDALGQNVVAKLRVTGPDNAKIQSIVAFGVNRDNPRPLVVPLVHYTSVVIAGINPWVGTHTSSQGRDMILPLCATASRQ